MSGHTPTPWQVFMAFGCKCYPGVTANGADIVIWGGKDSEDFGDDDAGVRGETDEQAEANARRIVAAVNGTAGISTEALEAGVVAKLAEALELADATLRGANMDKAHVEKVVSTALALTRGEQS